MTTESADPNRAELVIRPYSPVSLRDVADVWRFRELLWTLAERDIRVRYKQAAFGVLWAVIQPLIQMVVFTVLFNRMAGIRPDGPVSYALFTLAGVSVWTLFTTGLAQGSNSLVDNARVITKIYFPRVLVPLSAIAVAGVDFCVAAVVLLVAFPLTGTPFHATIVLMPVLGLVAAYCAFAFSLWLSALNVQFRDVRYALPFVLQLLIFLTPVFYPSSMVPAKFRIFVVLNPMAAVVDSFRAALFGTAIPWERLGLAMGITTVVAIGGFLFFRRVERTFADRI